MKYISDIYITDILISFLGTIKKSFNPKLFKNGFISNPNFITYEYNNEQFKWMGVNIVFTIKVT